MIINNNNKQQHTFENETKKINGNCNEMNENCVNACVMRARWKERMWQRLKRSERERNNQRYQHSLSM